MAVPKHLVARVGRCEVKSMLRTSDAVTAKMQARLLSNAFDRLFKLVPTMPNLTTDEINERIRGYFQSALNKSLEHVQLLPGDPMVDLDEEVDFLRKQVEDLRRKLARQTFSTAVVETAKELLAQSPSDPSPPALEAVQIACSGILRANIENARILGAKLQGRYDEAVPGDPLFAGMTMANLPPMPGEAAAPMPNGVTFKEVSERYLAFKVKEGWAKKTEMDARRAIGLGFEVISPTKPVKQITATDVQAVRDLIGAVPPNFGKLKGNETLTAKAAAEGNKTGEFLSLQTQEKMLRFFKTVLRWACDEGIIDKLPGEKVKVPGLKKLKAIENRHPYSKDQLTRIFASPAFTGHKSEGRRVEKGTMLVRDGKFWIPLVALFSGLRAGEIVQLLKADIREEDGIWYFDITKSDDDGKKLKTLSSERRVPIHAALLSLGFLDHVKKAKDGGRVFPDIPFGNDGYPSHNWSKWWGRYTALIKVATPKTAFHSFRHNFKDALQNAKVPEYVSRALMGHADDSVHGGYGSPLTLQLMKSEIDRIAFPGFEPMQLIAKPKKGGSHV
jgi:integrase